MGIERYRSPPRMRDSPAANSAHSCRVRPTVQLRLSRFPSSGMGKVRFSVPLAGSSRIGTSHCFVSRPVYIRNSENRKASGTEFSESPVPNDNIPAGNLDRRAQKPFPSYAGNSIMARSNDYLHYRWSGKQRRGRCPLQERYRLRSPWNQACPSTSAPPIRIGSRCQGAPVLTIIGGTIVRSTPEAGMEGLSG